MKTGEFIAQVRNGKIDIVEHTHSVIEECKKLDREYHYFNAISEELAIKQANAIKKSIKSKDKSIKNKRLLGIAVSVKDNICVKGVETTAGSRILKGYKPLFDATVVRKAVEQGAIIIGKTAQDEFGFGSFSANVGLGFKVPKNPFDTSRACGGSSGGAAGMTQKASFPHMALGQSTGGSVAAPSSFCGVFGLTPSYGRVSRYGLIDYGNSLDKIGTLGKNMHDAALLLECIAGFDENESTTADKPTEKYSELVNKKNNNKNIKIGIIKETFNGIDKNVEKNVIKGIEKLKDNGIKIEEVSLSLPIKYGLAAYYMLAASEASTNLAKYCGMRYGANDDIKGSFNEYFSKVRSEHFGKEAKRRIILGTFARMSGYRDAYYLKATKVRAKIIDEYRRLFKKYDALASPTMPILPPKLSEIEKLTPLQNYMMDIMTVSPNLAGLPHLSVPVGFEGKLPVGMMLTSDHFEEGKLVRIGNIFEGK